MKRTILSALLLAAAVATTGCGPHAGVATPPGFAVLPDQQEYVYRAASAEGVVLAVRAESDEPRGNLDFWADALDRQLQRSGYVPEGAAVDVRTATGRTGREIKYTREANGRKVRFWTAVVVADGRIWVVEAGGDADRFKGKVEQGVQRAIETLAL